MSCLPPRSFSSSPLRHCGMSADKVLPILSASFPGTPQLVFYAFLCFLNAAWPKDPATTARRYKSFMAPCIRRAVFLHQPVNPMQKPWQNTTRWGYFASTRLQFPWLYSITRSQLSSANEDAATKWGQSIHPRSCPLQVASFTRIKGQHG